MFMVCCVSHLFLLAHLWRIKWPLPKRTVGTIGKRKD
jgi:hypothetical protein